MSDHDFEKQVQQKMEQLKLRPSDAVWTKVDKRIRKERRRRRVVLWLPLFLLCVVAGGYFYFDAQSNNNKFTASELNSTQSHSDKNASESTSQTAGSTENKPVAGTDASPAATGNPQQSIPTENSTDQPALQPAPEKPGERNAVAPENNAPAVTNSTVQPEKGMAVVPRVNKSGNGNKKANRLSADLTKSVTVVQGNKPPRKSSGSPLKALVQNNDQPAANTVAVNDANPSSLPGKTDSGNVVSNFIPQQDTEDSAGIAAPSSTPAPAKVNLAQNQAPKTKKKPVVEPPKPAHKPSTWSFGIVAEGGASHISKGSPFSLLSKKNNEPEDLAMASPAPPNQNFYGGPAGFTQFPDNKPSELKSSIAWSAGGFVQKQLNKRISVSAGVQYSYFSMKTDVGQFMKSAISVSNANYDQIVSDYYQGRSALNVGGGLAATSYPRPPQQQEYTNKYHFLEIPVKIHWRVTGDEASLPIIVDGGLSVAKLLSTNALHYDGNNDVYYKDYDYFNKIQAGITAGVNVELFSESKHPIWIGPTIKYQLSNLITSDLSNGQHLWSFGLGAKFFLRK
ncbi:outer membrane beta-barrel protein [Pseudobacter ginsenosidimutans]|uniref:Outer membrane protein with beta-barrel domain n=1 Tax=Pseudobacter ginsenosidimutans TaxID=661488 RepID=A0A4V2EZ35_9BACT|nr:outer membrane beta-barrel protein [Pseudobacter ginsenosidimutans]QEC42733.1 outer membrane beta-barrel protein [Pseudobacter ginsenosidimutans]RZS65110.1 outer membrane protein with beta-barrel domain [Pseudobacter ginsenosidimutans]